MSKIVPCNVFTIITAVKQHENPCEVSTAARQKSLWSKIQQASYQEN